MEFNLNINQQSVTPNLAYNMGQPEAQAPIQAQSVPPLANAADLAANPAARNLQEYNAVNALQGPTNKWNAPEYQPIQPGKLSSEKLADEAENTKQIEMLLKHAQGSEELGNFKDAEKAYKKALKYTENPEHYKLYAGCLRKISTSLEDEAQANVYKEKASRAFYYLGELYSKAKTWEEAQAAYKDSCELALYESPLQALVEIAKHLEDTTELADALEKLADFYTENGIVELAIDKLESASRLVQSVQVLEKLGVLYAKEAKPDGRLKAQETRIQSFELQISEDPKNIGLYRDYVWFLKDIGRKSEARAVTKRKDELLQAVQQNVQTLEQKAVKQKTKIVKLRTELEALKRIVMDLDLSQWTNIMDAELIPLLKQHPYIQSLNLRGCDQFTDAALAQLVDLKQLKEFNLCGCDQLTDAALAHLADLTQLTSLNLCGCDQLTDGGLAHLADLTRLTSLNLCGCVQLTDGGLAHLADLRQLQDLNLYNCGQLTGGGLAQLTGLKQLKKLDLGGCNQLMDDVLAQLAGLKQLTSLNLYECTQLTDGGLAHLAGLTQLNKLYLGGCKKLTAGAKKALKKQIPGLMIQG